MISGQARSRRTGCPPGSPGVRWRCWPRSSCCPDWPASPRSCCRYLASDLDTLSLPDLARGAPDAGLRPEDGIPEWLLLPGFAALLLAPLGALLALGGCVVQLLAAFPRHQHRVSPGVAAGLGLVAVVCLGVLSYFLSPLGQALTTWQLD